MHGRGTSELMSERGTFLLVYSVLQMSQGRYMGMTLYGGNLSTILGPRESSKMKCLAGCWR